MRQGEWHWSYNVMIAGIFLGSAGILILAPLTFITSEGVFRLLVFCCVLALLVPYRWARSAVRIERLEHIFLSVLGIGPLLTLAVLGSNYVVRESPRIETYRIVRSEPVGKSFLPGDIRLTLEDDAYAAYPAFRTFYSSGESGVYNAHAVSYEVARGLWGYDVLLSHKFHRE